MIVLLVKKKVLFFKFFLKNNGADLRNGTKSLTIFTSMASSSYSLAPFRVMSVAS